MKILFIRHGESTDDIDDQYGGWGDFHLTNKGKEQIEKRVPELDKLDIKFDKIYSSPLLRAKETATILSERLGIPKEVFIYVKEKNGYGLLSGLKKDEAKKTYPDLVDALEKNNYVDGATREKDFITRVKKSIEILKDYSEENVIVVTHGGYLKYMFKYILGMSLKSYEDGGWALVDIDESKVLESDGFLFD